MHTLHWKSSLSSSHLRFFKNGIQFGTLSKDPWIDSGKAQLDDINIRFEHRGVINQVITIYDSENDVQLGSISFNSWGNAAKIQLTGDRTFEWSFDNFWNTEWTIYKNGDKIIRYVEKGTKGEAEVINEDENGILFLAGLLCPGHVRHLSAAVIVIILLPLLL